MHTIQGNLIIISIQESGYSPYFTGDDTLELFLLLNLKPTQFQSFCSFEINTRAMPSSFTLN